MKTALTLSLALLAFVPAQAQVFGPRAGSGLFYGSVAGAVIGHNSGSLGHNAWRGAAYGAGAGLLIGSWSDRNHSWRTAGQVRWPSSYYSYSYPRTYVYRSSPSYYYYDRGYGYGSDVTYRRSDYAGNGLFLGALAGAIIGRNSGSFGHNAWRGAAYGAAAGYILGSVAESRARDNDDYYVTPTETTSTTVAQASAPAATPVPVVAPAAVTPMSSANALFGRN